MKLLLEEIELYLNQLLFSNKELLQKEEVVLREYSRLSRQNDKEPWVFVTETLNRREREIIEPLRLLIKKLNKVIDDLEYIEKGVVLQNEFSLVLIINENST